MLNKNYFFFLNEDKQITTIIRPKSVHLLNSHNLQSLSMSSHIFFSLDGIHKMKLCSFCMLCFVCLCLSFGLLLTLCYYRCCTFLFCFIFLFTFSFFFNVRTTLVIQKQNAHAYIKTKKNKDTWIKHRSNV